MSLDQSSSLEHRRFPRDNPTELVSVHGYPNPNCKYELVLDVACCIQQFDGVIAYLKDVTRPPESTTPNSVATNNFEVTRVQECLCPFVNFLSRQKDICETCKGPYP